MASTKCMVMTLVCGAAAYFGKGVMAGLAIYAAAIFVFAMLAFMADGK